MTIEQEGLKAKILEAREQLDGECTHNIVIYEHPFKSNGHGKCRAVCTECTEIFYADFLTSYTPVFGAIRKDLFEKKNED